MQATNIAATGGSPLFAGLFGAQNQGAGGLFGLMMALFGQSTGQTGLLQPAGQNMPTALQGGTPALPKLPVGTMIEIAQSGETSAASGAELLSWLQSLSANADISATLKNLLAGEQIDLATFQQRLGNLDESQCDAVMGEIASLLQPVLIQQPILPVQTRGQTEATADLEATSDIRPDAGATQPAPLVSAPEATGSKPPAAPLPANPEDQATATHPLAAAQQDHPASQPEKAPTRRDGKIRLAGLEAASPTEKAAIDFATQAGIALPAAPAHAKQGTEAKKAASTTDSEKASSPPTLAAAAASPASQPAHQTTPQSQRSPSDNAGSVQGITSGGGAEKQADSGLGDLKADTQQAQAALPAADKQANAASFADHMQQVKLNRTGAHMPVAEQISVHLGKAVSEGRDRFTVKLSPAELGRIEIRIDLSADGRVTASFQVDQPATLDLLQRDQRGLERVLSDAGLKADGSSLNFNLRGEGQGHQQGGQQAQNNNGGNGNPGFSLDGDAATDTPIAGTMELTWYVGPDRVDVRI